MHVNKVLETCILLDQRYPQTHKRTLNETNYRTYCAAVILDPYQTFHLHLVGNGITILSPKIINKCAVYGEVVVEYLRGLVFFETRYNMSSNAISSGYVDRLSLYILDYILY